MGDPGKRIQVTRETCMFSACVNSRTSWSRRILTGPVVHYMTAHPTLSLMHVVSRGKSPATSQLVLDGPSAWPSYVMSFEEN